MNGLTGIVAKLYNTFEPDIRITAAKGKYFKPSEAKLRDIYSIPGIEYVSQTITDKVLIKNMDMQSLVTLKGVDGSFNEVTKIDSAIMEGVYGLEEPGRDRMVMGRGVANQLGVTLSVFVNELSIFSPIRGKAESLNPDANLNQVYCTPSGIFSLNDELDFQFAFVNIQTARKLFDLTDDVTALELSVKPGSEADVEETLETMLGERFVVKNRYELNDVLFRSLETEKLATFIILAFILVIATFNIIGALTMLIIEKKKDIKTLYSMGAHIGLIRNIFMREGLLITGVGAVIGLLAGLLVCWLQAEFHLVKFGNEFIVPYYPVEMQLVDFIRIFLLIMLIGFLAALYPVRVFTKMKMVK
jgi:lipoprotein-releasing system permease protein